MQKIINGIEIFSGVVALGVVGLGGYVFIRKDAIIDGVKSKVKLSVLDSVTPDLGGIAGDAIPDFTGPFHHYQSQHQDRNRQYILNG